MARLLIFDSSAVLDADGNTVDGSATYPGGGAIAASAKFSKPVRLYGAADGDVMKVGFEFWITSASTFTLSWYMQFWNDRPVSYPLPTSHVSAIESGQSTWAREQTEELQGNGTVRHYNAQRDILTAGGTSWDVRYFPMVVHGLFVRLALLSSAPPASETVRVYAVVGGVDQQTIYEAQTTPWTSA